MGLVKRFDKAKKPNCQTEAWLFSGHYKVRS
jgi:hypothetical protein